MLVKKSRRGKVFYGCSEYPKCDAVFWDKPVAEICPQCGKPFLLEKYNAKKEETIRYCSEEGCEYKTVNGELASAKKPAAKKGVKRAAKAKAAES
jgi:ssDNA-binding Zn-finger/Zn-ribbon topoisomerase 1